MDLSRYAELFLAEAREHISTTHRLLLTLESRPEDIAAVDEIFRSVHTIKGMAATMGYATTTGLCHALEHLLDKLRSGGVPIDSNVVDVLLEAVDAVESAAVREVAGLEAGDPSRPLERIHQVVAGDPAPSGGSPPDGASSAPLAGPIDRAGQVPAGSGGIVKIRQDRLDAVLDHLGELVIARDRLVTTSRSAVSADLAQSVEDLSRLVSHLQDEIMRLRMVPVGEVFDRFPRMVRDAARALGKQVELELRGRDQELDRSLLNELGDILVHLLRNAIDHGLEPPAERATVGKPEAGVVRVTAEREREALVVRVEDDGRGIQRARVLQVAIRRGMIPAGEADGLTDSEISELLTRPGFSTAARLTEVSGRGVGLDAVRSRLQRLGGSLDVASAEGDGTACTVRLPLTLAIVRVLLVDVRGHSYAVPIPTIIEVIEAGEGEVERGSGGEWIRRHGQSLPLARLPTILHPDDHRAMPVPVPVVVVDAGGSRLALAVDGLRGQQEAVLKPFDATTQMTNVFAGATLLSDGRPALILDAAKLAVRLRGALAADAA